MDLREIANGLLYVLCTGCPWRSIPHDLPPWGTVWTSFRQWRDGGTLDRLHDELRAQVRQQAGRDPHPSAVILDSQSVRTTEKAMVLRVKPREAWRRDATACGGAAARSG